VTTAALISALNVVSGAVALLISYYAYKNNRLVGSILLRYISYGFLLLGVGLLFQAGTEIIVKATAIDALSKRAIDLVAFLIYTALQLIAYGVFAWGYGLSFFSQGSAKAAAVPGVLLSPEALSRKALEYTIFVLAIYIASQAAIVVLLFLIVYHGVRVFNQNHSNLSLMVLFGFVLIFFAHLLMLASALLVDNTIFLVGNTIEVCGFVSLLFFLYWSGHVVK
jgi:hypothetical protein